MNKALAIIFLAALFHTQLILAQTNKKSLLKNLPYARLGIPSLMYTTLLHPDYHTPKDNAQNIDYGKLYKMTQWIYRTAWKIVNAPTRPATDANFKLER